MNRRELFLKVWTRLMRAGIAAVIGIPAVQYVLDTFRKAPQTSATFVRVKRLKDLPPHKPTLVPIMGRKLDAWTQYEETIVGRVWLVRLDEGEAGENSKVIALSSICPHTGCQVRSTSDQPGFFCPCHQAKFAENGDIAGSVQPGAASPAPRGMDSLKCDIVKLEATGDFWVEVRYEKFKQGDARKIPLA